MATEDLLTYTETDAGGLLAVTNSRVTGTNVDVMSAARLYKDFGTSYFGDFTHFFTINRSSRQNVSDMGGYAVGEAIDYLQNAFDTNKTFIYLSYNQNSAGTLYRWLFRDCNTKGIDTAANQATPITRYIKVTRRGNIASCYIYSNDTFTTLEDTLIIRCNMVPLRYLYAQISFADGDGGLQTGYQENLDIEGRQGGNELYIEAVNINRGKSYNSTISCYNKDVRYGTLSINN